MLVSNSSTIILIAKATLLSKFLDSVKNVTITKVIHDEIIKKDSFENLSIKKEIEKGRIKVEIVDDRLYLTTLKHFKLDEGEASAFALLQERKYNGILTDDKELIKLCKIEDIKFTSAMAVVVKLFKKRIINKTEALEKIEKLQGYGRYSNELYNYYKNMVK